MPLPFLAAAAVIGVSSIVGAAAKSVNNDYEEELYSINSKAERLAEETEESFAKTRRETEQKLARYSALKKDIYKTTLKDFVEHFRKIKNIEISQNTNLIEKIHGLEIQSLDFSSNARDFEYKDERTEAIKGAVLGTVLGGAYLLGSVVKGVKLQYAIDEAKANYAKLKAEAEKVKKEETKISLIGKRTDELRTVLETVNRLFALAIGQMKQNIETTGNDYSSYSTEQREQLFLAVQFAEAAKKLLDVQVISSGGKASAESRQILAESKKMLESAS